MATALQTFFAASGGGESLFDPGSKAGANTIIGGLAALSRGSLDKKNSELEAMQLENEATQEELSGRNDVLSIARQLNDDLAQINLAGGGSGASHQAFSNEAVNVANENKINSKFGSRLKVAALKSNASSARNEGRLSKIASVAQANYIVDGHFERVRRRG